MSFAKSIYRSALFKSAVHVSAGAYRAALLARARNMTDDMGRNSALVMAPHPDDETLGCGAAIIRKLDAGLPVSVLVVTDGRSSHESAVLSPDALAEIRKREAIDACAVLGVAEGEVRFLDFRDQTLEENMPALTERLCAIVAELGPGDIFIPSAIDGNPDHRALNAAALTAIGRVGSNARIFEYPIWFWDPKAWIDRNSNPIVMAFQLLVRPLICLFRLQPVFVDSSRCLAQKRQAFAQHRSQSVNITGEAKWNVIDDRTLRFLIDRQELFFLRR
jgi:LmbE family N-acetylglucosaminyl deacetylase